MLMTEARKATGLSQAELAAKISRPQSFVSKYELGERRLDVVEFLEVAEALGVNPARVIRKVESVGTGKRGRRRARRRSMTVRR